jgi:hypothetical protein
MAKTTFTTNKPLVRFHPSMVGYIIADLCFFVLMASFIIYSAIGVNNGLELSYVLIYLTVLLSITIFKISQYAIVEIYKRSFVIIYPFRLFRKIIRFRINKVHQVDIISRRANKNIIITYQEEDRVSKNSYPLNNFSKDLETLAEALDELGMEVSYDH